MFLINEMSEKSPWIRTVSHFNRRSRRVKPINHKMKYNFQDQTLTEKLNTPPKSKGWSNGLCQIPGNFYEARTAKFWYVVEIIGTGILPL